MDLVCFDTQQMIWGIKEQATEGEEDMVARTKAFIRHLDEKGTRILVPSIVVAELLIRVPPELHSMVSNLVERSFVVGDFDLRASSCFARMWRDKKDRGVIQTLQHQASVAKVKLRADCMIAATAVANGASCIYSHDKDVKAIAEGHILVREVPLIEEQLDLFDPPGGATSATRAPP